MSSPDVKQYFEELYKILNKEPNKSTVSDDTLRGLVRNFQEQYNFKKEEEEKFVKDSFAKKKVDELLSRSGASLATTPEQKIALITAANKDFSFDELKKDEAVAIRADIKLATDREFSKIVKRISYALSNNYLDSNRFLIWAIALSSKRTIKYDLLLISLILRYGKAERNMYLLVPEYGNVHLLVYTVLELEKKLNRTTSLLKYKDTSVDIPTINSILLLLTLLGSKTTSLAIYEEKIKFDEKGIPQYDSRILSEASKRDRRVYEVTVAQWLVSKKYSNYIEPENELKYFNSAANDGDTTLMTYGLLTDKVDYAFPLGKQEIVNKNKDFGKITISKTPPPQPPLTEVIFYNATEVGKEINIVNYIRSSESDVLRYCIDSLALEVFDTCLKRGIKMSYFTVNRLCLAFKKATDPDINKAKKVDSIMYLGMLLKCANYGVRIDQYQLEIIKSRDGNYKGEKPGGNVPSKQIQDAYQKPLFEKACSTTEKAPMPKSLILIADSLGALKVDKADSSKPIINKKETCNELYKLSKDDPERIKEEAMIRIKDRIRTTAYTLSEFTSGIFTNIECENKPNNRDPLEYVDTALTYYKDDKNKLYCFPSFTYEDIKASGFVNPITGELISVEARNRISNQLEMFKKLNINPNKVLPVEIAAEFLKNNETITNDNTKYAEETIINMFRSRGVPEPILKNLTTETFNKILKIVSMCQGYLPELEPKHRFATFCKALYSFLKKNVEQVPYVLNAITVQQSVPLGPKPIPE
jgi:hypothetical protein